MTGALPSMLLAVILSGVLAGAVLWGLERLFRVRGAPARGPAPRMASSFLIRDGRLVDHDAGLDLGITTWAELRAWLGERFTGLPDALPGPGHAETCRFAARQTRDGASLTIAAVRGGHRVTLLDPNPPGPAHWHDATFRLASKRAFRGAIEAAPIAICTLAEGGGILWRNSRFQAFSEAEAADLVAAATGAGDSSVRTALADPLTGSARHFELSTTRHGNCHVLYAVDITRQVEAETMRGTFIQTLTKTFADLATGLAVFDRDQRLVLFNPAMTDLTGLPVEFLSGRPGLLDFFDRLRDRQVLPEPRDYATWRAQINDMIESAAGGHYAEAWTLPTGLTYRVTGRPHPDGAIAFLIEDITDQVSLTRRSRTQIEIRQATLDGLDAAVAVIGPDGLVLLCNRACRELLGIDPSRAFAETGADDLLRVCRARFPDAGFWNAAAIGRQPLAARLFDSAGAPVLARREPLPQGFSMLCLTPEQRAEQLTA